MKKLKYLLVFLLAVCLAPKGVKATYDVYFKPMAVGDEVTVTLDKAGNIKQKFIVIKASGEGTVPEVADQNYKGNNAFEYVTLIAVGNVGKSIYDTTPGKQFFVDGGSSSKLYSNLAYKTRLIDLNDLNKGWVNPEEVRLLKASEFNTLSSYSWIKTNAPYWLGENSNGDKAKAVSAAGAIEEIDITTEAYMRPVIRIHKGFIDGAMICNCKDCEEKFCPNDKTISIQACLDAGTSEAECIKKLCTKPEKLCPNDKTISIQGCIDKGTSEKDCIKKLCPGTEVVENPKTGNTTIGLGALLLVMVACVGTLVKKNYFSK